MKLRLTAMKLRLTEPYGSTKANRATPYLNALLLEGFTVEVHFP